MIKTDREGARAGFVLDGESIEFWLVRNGWAWQLVNAEDMPGLPNRARRDTCPYHRCTSEKG